MKEKYLLRGTGFIGSNLRKELPEYLDLPRDWDFAPQADNIFYLASYGNYYDQIGVEEIYKANLTEPIRLLNQLHDFNSFVYISTSSVLLPTQTFYSASKGAMEELVRVWYGRFKTPVVCVRPSSVTGVGEQPQHLIPKLIRSCLYGESMPFVEEPTHDFIDVFDFVQGLLYVSNNIDRFKGKSVNISFGRSYSNQEVLKLVEEITGKKANIKMVESLRSYDAQNWEVPDDLPFIPKKTLRQIIREMVEHERKNPADK